MANVTFRNDFGEGRIVPHIGYHLVELDGTVQVPEEEAHHWVAGGWTRVDDSAPAAPAIPAAAPAAPAKTATATPEGTVQ
jgi:hypothetical protein